jgi:hypothetical protein
VAVRTGHDVADAAELVEYDFLLHDAIAVDFEAAKMLAGERGEE